jgi:hypothetical protein
VVLLKTWLLGCYVTSTGVYFPKFSKKAVSYSSGSAVKYGVRRRDDCEDEGITNLRQFGKYSQAEKA